MRGPPPGRSVSLISEMIEAERHEQREAAGRKAKADAEARARAERARAAAQARAEKAQAEAKAKEDAAEKADWVIVDQGNK